MKNSFKAVSYTTYTFLRWRHAGTGTSPSLVTQNSEKVFIFCINLKILWLVIWLFQIHVYYNRTSYPKNIWGVVCMMLNCIEKWNETSLVNWIICAKIWYTQSCTKPHELKWKPQSLIVTQNLVVYGWIILKLSSTHSVIHD